MQLDAAAQARPHHVIAIDLPFSSTEYAGRLTVGRRAMSARGLDALFIEDPSNMAWLTGYDGWSFYLHQGVIVTHDRDALWWGRRQNGSGALRTVWMRADSVHCYDDGFFQSTERHPMQDLAARLSDQAHKPDEFVTVAQLEECLNLLDRLAERLSAGA